MILLCHVTAFFYRQLARSHFILLFVGPMLTCFFLLFFSITSFLLLSSLKSRMKLKLGLLFKHKPSLFHLLPTLA